MRDVLGLSWVSQSTLCTDSPTVITGETPPDPKPVASDITTTKSCFAGKVIGVEKSPWLLLKLLSGMAILDFTANAYEGPIRISVYGIDLRTHRNDSQIERWATSWERRVGRQKSTEGT